MSEDSNAKSSCLGEPPTITFEVVQVAMTKHGTVRNALRKKESVIMNLYKGQSYLEPSKLISQPVMFRVRVQFVGDLAKYLPVDSAAAKEVIETVDIHYELMEYFFSRRSTRSEVKAKLHPLVDQYFAKNIGDRVGTIEMGHSDFAEFVSFMRYLCYEPLTKKEVL
jgi:hypothetical protein